MKQLLVAGLIALLATGCSSTFTGYRQSRLTPAESRVPDRESEEGRHRSHPLNLSPSPDLDSQVELLPVPAETAVPFTPTEYRQVYIAPHKNQYGDAVHGHRVEVLFSQAQFHAQPSALAPPTAPVLVDKETVKTPSGLVPPPTSIQDYLKQQGLMPKPAAPTPQPGVKSDGP